MTIYKVYTAFGEYEQNLEIRNRVLSYHESFVGAEKAAKTYAKRFFKNIKPMREQASAIHSYLRLYSSDTGSYVEVSPIEVLP